MRIEIDLRGLEDKWSLQSEEYPICCVCGVRVGADEHTPECDVSRAGDCDEEYFGPDCTCGADEHAIRLWRGEGKDMQELAFCHGCFDRRTNHLPIDLWQ